MLVIAPRTRPTLAGVLIGLLAVLVSCATALAAPVTVKLRVEGPTETLFEGEIATQGETFETLSSKGPHPCDYSENGFGGREANGGSASGTPTTALRDAARANGLAFNAEWFGSGAKENENPGDFLVTQVGSDENETSPPYDSWGYAVNDTTAPVGGCQIALAPGSEVLWAYNYFNLHHLLSLTGPASVDAGTPFSVHVVDGQTGQPIAGAAIGEVFAGVTTPIPASPTTDANGNATIALAHTGTVTLKATQAESVRSGGLVVCVHNGNDGTCGTTVACATASTCVLCAATSSCGGPLGPSTGPPPPPEVARAGGVVSGRVYSRRAAPRILGGSVEVPAGDTLHEVRIALTRSVHHRCFAFSGRRGAFVRAGCHTTRFFDVADTTSFSYLLPARLPAGRYVYDIEALDDAGHATQLADGVSHVVFYVK
jgi:hypothetical protein